MSLDTHVSSVNAMPVSDSDEAVSDVAELGSRSAADASGLERGLFNRDWNLRLNLRISPYHLFLTAILLIALAMRMYGTDWDQGGLFHPDERDFLGRAERLDFAALSNPSEFLSVDSRLNPKWFNYGNMPLYALAAVKAIASPFTDLDWNLFDLRFAGRNLAAVTDTVTILFVFLLARRLFDLRAGLTAALLAALAVIHIQNAHYTAVDVPMTLFVTATVYFSVRFIQDGKVRDSALSGAMLGLAIASKSAAAPVGAAIVAAHVLYAFGPLLRGVSWRDIDQERVVFSIRVFVASASIALLVLLIVQPYMFIDWSNYFGNVTSQSEMVRRVVDLPFTRQYIDTTPYWYQMQQLSVWGLGVSLGIAVWLGLGWAIGRAVVCRDHGIIVALAFLLPYLLITGWFEVKFLRYMLPAVPILLIFTAGMAWWLYDRVVRRLSSVPRYGAYAVVAVGMVLLVHYSFAYLKVFSGEHPGQAVSQWLRENAEPGSVVIQEHWEEGIPHVPGLDMHDRIPMYEADSKSKYEEVTRLMANADYLILFSNRLSATIPRLPDRYPVGSLFYELLFNGDLGYGYAYSVERNPELLGVMYRDDPYARVSFSEPSGYPYPEGGLLTLNLGWADESHTVYEHPHSIVFENRGRFSSDELLERLRLDELLVGPEGFAHMQLGLTLSDSELQAQRSGGTWTSVFYLENLDSRLAWLVWLAVIQVIALSAVPLSYLIFRPLPDRGYLFSKPLGLLLVATLAWLFASYGWFEFSVFSVALSIVLLAGFSGLLLWRLRDEMMAYFRAHWRTVAIGEVIFLVAFLAFFLIRLANPDLWHAWRGGEKPMDFAYLNAITRSSVMPPYDPWFAGGYLNYYYYGQFIIASVIRLTGLAPTVAYNLAVPTLFALTVIAAYTITYNLVSLTIRSRGVGRIGLSPVVFGLVAAILTAVAANIDGLVQVYEGVRRVLLEAQPFGNFDYWRSSRMLEPGTGGNEITEFPFFTFLYADLHAHMVAIPFAILGLGLGVSVFLRAGLQRVAKLETFISLAVLGIVVGSLRIINSWDFPTQMLLAAGFVFVGEVLFGQDSIVRRLLVSFLKIVVVGVVGYLIYLPFHMDFELFSDGIQRSDFQTPLWRYMAIHSVFLFAIFSWVLMEWRQGAFGFNRAVRRLIPIGWYSGWSPLFITFGLGMIGASLFFLFPNYSTVLATLAGAVILAVTALMAFAARHRSQRYTMVVAFAAAMALLLAAGVDLVTVNNDIGRQNTIFKFYIQAWWLLSIASGFAIWRLWDSGAFSLRSANGLRVVWMGVFAVIAVGVMIYPVLGTRVRLADRFNHIGAGIDGEAYMNDASYSYRGQERLDLEHDLAGIDWLRANAIGSPVIVEGVWELYTWGQRVSIYTGLPTVIGWDWHQTQQRLDYSWAIRQRTQEVRDFYSSDDMTAAVDFLEKHDVSYIYVGEMERQIYPEQGVDKFDRMVSLGVERVFQDGPVSIYQYVN